eukprot:366126-Chlamydomonas_euryale.AAC.4
MAPVARRMLGATWQRARRGAVATTCDATRGGGPTPGGRILPLADGTARRAQHAAPHRPQMPPRAPPSAAPPPKPSPRDRAPRWRSAGPPQALGSARPAHWRGRVHQLMPSRRWRRPCQAAAGPERGKLRRRRLTPTRGLASRGLNERVKRSCATLCAGPGGKRAPAAALVRDDGRSSTSTRCMRRSPRGPIPTIAARRGASSRSSVWARVGVNTRVRTNTNTNASFGKLSSTSAAWSRGEKSPQLVESRSANCSLPSNVAPSKRSRMNIQLKATRSRTSATLRTSSSERLRRRMRSRDIARTRSISQTL